MKEQKVKFQIIVNDDDFINNEKYSLENEYNESICFIKTAKLFDNLFAKYKDLFNKYEEYEESNLCRYKSQIRKKNPFFVNDKNLLGNTKFVNISVIKNNKKITLNELKISDDLVKYYAYKEKLYTLVTTIASHKKVRDNNEYNDIIDNFSAKYKNNKEKGIVNLLLNTTKKAYIVLQENYNNESIKRIVIDYLELLDKYKVNFVINKFEYSIVTTTLSDVSQLKPLQIIDIGKFSKTFDKLLTKNDNNIEDSQMTN